MSPQLAGLAELFLGSSSLHGFSKDSPSMPPFFPMPRQMPGDCLFTRPRGAGPQVLVDKPVRVAMPLTIGLSPPEQGLWTLSSQIS